MQVATIRLTTGRRRSSGLSPPHSTRQPVSFRSAVAAVSTMGYAGGRFESIAARHPDPSGLWPAWHGYRGALGFADVIKDDERGMVVAHACDHRAEKALPRPPVRSTPSRSPVSMLPAVGRISAADAGKAGCMTGGCSGTQCLPGGNRLSLFAGAARFSHGGASILKR